MKSIAMIGLVAITMIGTGCKKKKEVVKAPEGETPITEYCSGPDFFSSKDYFRASGLGESMDQATAKKKALNNARADLAATLQVTINSVIDNYVNSREFNNKEEIEERFEGLTREIVKQNMVGVKTICSQPVKVNSTGNIKYYVALELSGDDIVSKYHERISKDERLRIDYDYEKFKETFDKEMEKLENR
ncbi:MAG: hypothetical protein AAF487_00690 [Bacteroidota bacterium]